MCAPMNNKTLEPMLDVAIIFEDNLYCVYGITESFKMICLGKYDNVFNAYGVKLSYGFKECTYEVPISPFEHKTVKFDFD